MNSWKRSSKLRIEGHTIGYALVEDALQVDVAGAAKRISCPWRIIHGAQDEVVPVSDAQVLSQASDGKAELIIVPGADHQFSQPDIREQLLDQIAAFLDQALQTP
jgi:pimeloyl-ACP methyl ester carboxylesterase